MQRSMAWIFVALFGLGLVAARRFARGDAEAQDTLARHPAKGTTDRAGVTSIRRTRPALGIPPLDGNAWDDLTAVVRGLVPDPTAFDAAGADRPHVPVGADVRARLRGAVRCPCTPPDLFEPFEPGVFAGRFALQVLDDAVGDDLAVGRDDEALDLLAAMAAMTADLERTTRLLPVSVAAATATRIHCRLAQVLGAGTRSDGLRRLGTVLDQLEPLRPRPADVLRVLDVDMRAAIFERARCARGPTSLHDVWARSHGRGRRGVARSGRWSGAKRVRPRYGRSPGRRCRPGARRWRPCPSPSAREIRDPRRGATTGAAARRTSSTCPGRPPPRR